MTTELTDEALADNLDNLVAYYDGRGGEHACMGLDDRDNVALAATRLRSQPAPSSEETAEIQRLSKDRAALLTECEELMKALNRQTELLTGARIALAQARKEALEEAAGIADQCERIIIRSEDREWNAACRSVADALRSRAGEIGGGE